MDVVAIAAHPDDVEMTVGGIIAKLVHRGRSVAIVDFTRGEMGTRGTAETREKEAAAAARVLGVTARHNLDFGDGVMENSLANRARLIEVLRELRPQIVLAPHWDDLHPDHSTAGRIVSDIMYPIGFPKFPATGQPFRPREFLFYMQHFTVEPSFIVDITGFHEQKMESVRCFASQLHDPRSAEPVTNIARPDFLVKLEARARFFGSQIGVEFGEPLVSRRPVPVDDPLELYRAVGGMR